MSIVSLAKEGTMTHSQKTIKANAGFRMMGVLSAERGSKTKVVVGKLVRHYELPPKTIHSHLPLINSESNR